MKVPSTVFQPSCFGAYPHADKHRACSTCQEQTRCATQAAETRPRVPLCFGDFQAAVVGLECRSCYLRTACEIGTTRRLSLTSSPRATPSPVGANSRQVAGSHYKGMGVEPWDVIDTWPLEQRIGAYRAGELKYLMRMGSKDARLQEIRKGGHYNEKLAEVLSEATAQEAAAQQQAEEDRQALLQRIIDAYQPDDSVTDYQDKIRELLVPNANA